MIMTPPDLGRAHRSLVRLGYVGKPSLEEMLQYCQRTSTGAWRKIFTRETAKTKKSLKVRLDGYDGVATAIQYLAPATEAGGGTVCPFATPSCIKLCLGKTSGRMRMPTHKACRIKKYWWWKLGGGQYLARMEQELRAFVKWCERNNYLPSARPNGTSDMPWEITALMTQFPEITWYDYSKWPLEDRLAGMRGEPWPENYTLTYSVSERPDSIANALRYLEQGHSAAIVIGGYDDGINSAKAAVQRLVEHGELAGHPVVDGDKHDVRFLAEERGSWVLLSAKGDAAKDRGGFVYRPSTPGGVVTMSRPDLVTIAA